MDSSSIRDILTSFSPALDYFAICSGDARIKIWDTLKGQVQTEFADIASNETMSLSGNRTEKGHLSVDYTCMKWLYLDRKKKRKLGSSLLVLGTGSGDVLALDVSAGQLKWRLSDFHAGGVTSISFAEHGSRIFSAGADGMVCEIDPLMGNLLGKFRASTKGISCLAVSSDGKILATAAGQLKTFNCSDHKKIQKFSGHLGAVRFMMFSEDGKYILSSAVGERYVAIWKTDEVKKQSACCVLAMEHPAVFIDCRCFDNRGADDAGIYVMAISETGVCYFWYGQTVEELRNTEATKASLSSEEGVPKSQKGALPAIFAAKLQGIAKPASVHAFVAYGLLVKPTFQKIIVHSGADINLNCSQDGLFLARCQSLIKSKKGRDVQNRVTVLDRANAEDALLPFPKIFDIYDKKNRQQILSTDIDDEVMNDLVDGKSQANFLEIKDYKVDVEADSQTVCLEDQLRSLGILSNNDDIRMNSALESSLFSGVDLEANTLEEKRRKRKKEILPSMIKNKEKRSAVHAKLKHQKKVEKRRKLKARDAEEKRALELGEEPPTRKTPRTIENTRDPDETVCRPDDDELFVGNDADEFSSILKQESIHKILITTCRFNSGRGPAFISELLTVIPNSHYYKRGTYDLKKIVEYAKKKDFTSIIVVHTNRREPDALLVIGLPDGPTAHFKLSKLVLRKDIKNHGNPTGHMPELVLNNFTTRLGHRVGRLIQSLFPQIPEFHGRRVVTFHNQRDFIFFRHHRYIFETKGGKGSDSKCKKAKDAKSEKINQERMIARLQQCGPRFTLKLVSLQHGTFDTKGGEFEWVHKPEMDTSRRRFFL